MATVDLMAKALAALTDLDASVTDVVHSLLDPGEVTEPLGISEVAELLDVSPHTLRYYERCGLITVARDVNDHRRYDAAAVRRLVFLTRMRLSGMPMRDLQHYVELVDRGEGTVPERLDLLIEHRDTVRLRIRELQLSLVASEWVDQARVQLLSVEGRHAARSSRRRRCCSGAKGANSCFSTARTAMLAWRRISSPSWVSSLGSARP